jgi:sulfhydrogenase subunit beta (sulfur reductase)
MIYKILDKKNYLTFVENLSANELTIAPVAKENRFVLAAIKSPAQLADRTAYIPTLIPHKKYLLPRRDALIEFKSGDEPQVAPKLENPRMVFLEVRPCDINGIRQLDQFFLGDIADEHYAARREAVSIIGLDCSQVCDEYCFCGGVGTSTAHSGYDLLFNDQGEYYLINIGTPRGADLLNKYASPREATEELITNFHNSQVLKLSQFPKRLSPDLHSIPLLLTGSYDSGLWAELGKIDLACGACNVTCPTCSCFDVQDRLELDLISGERQRKWDGCMLHEFALVASGENFRPGRDQRVRHRIYRKFKYQMQKYGEPYCVGCGRCSRSCLVDIRPDVVLNRLFDEIGKAI